LIFVAANGRAEPQGIILGLGDKRLFALLALARFVAARIAKLLLTSGFVWLLADLAILHFL